MTLGDSFTSVGQQVHGNIQFNVEYQIRHSHLKSNYQSKQLLSSQISFK
jgi:hypothetical protein